MINNEPTGQSILPHSTENCFGGLAHLWFFIARATTTAAAPRFAVLEAWAPRMMSSGDFSYPQYRPLRFVHQDYAPFLIRIMPEARPGPLSGFEHQSALYWVAMHIAQFFHSLLLAKYHQVIESDATRCALGMIAALVGVTT